MPRLTAIVLALGLLAPCAAAEGSGLWLVRLEQGADWIEGKPDEAQPHSDETREVMRELIRRGVVVLAGRAEGAGLLVIRSVDAETAQGFVGTLPTVEHDVHRYSLTPFELFHAADLTGLARPPRPPAGGDAKQ